MKGVPIYRVAFTYTGITQLPHDLEVRVPEPELDAFFRVLRFNRVVEFSCVLEQPSQGASE